MFSYCCFVHKCKERWQEGELLPRGLCAYLIIIDNIIAEWLRAWVLEADYSGLNPRSATSWLCDLGPFKQSAK